MGKHSDNLKMFYNVLRRTSGGADTLSEYARVQSDINGMQTYNELNPPQPPTVPPQATNQPLSGQSDTTMPPLGDNGLNTPIVE